MLDRAALIDACRAHGRVVRVVVARVQGSAPREPGASMLVWEDGQSGTIGGGALELELSEAARTLAQDAWTTHALGPDLGQCCGGAVDILCEVYDLKRAQSLPEDVLVRGPGDMPFSVSRILQVARSQGALFRATFVDGWLVEPVSPPRQALWVWGAGHVGRALVDVLAPLPGMEITWVDTGPERFPANVPAGTTVLLAANPGILADFAPKDAQHLVLTYSHAIDLDLCHRLLTRGFDRCGLIGSRTKWTRFRKRLRMLGHAPDQIARIECPIGDPGLGKHPRLIALGVAVSLVQNTAQDRLLESRA